MSQLAIAFLLGAVFSAVITQLIEFLILLSRQKERKLKADLDLPNFTGERERVGGVREKE